MKSVLLACTDLQNIISSIKLSIPIVDSTEIPIKASMQELLYK